MVLEDYDNLEADQFETGRLRELAQQPVEQCF